MGRGGERKEGEGDRDGEGREGGREIFRRASAL